MPMPSPAYRCAAEDVVHASRVDPQRGLASAEVAARQQAVGPNALAVQPPRAAWRRLLDQFRDPLIYLLLAAVSVSLLVWWIEGAHGWPVDAAVILGIVVLNGLIGYAQEARSEQAAAALARLTEVTSAVRREGRSQRVPSAELVPGDILLLGEGDLVGADARLLTAARLTVQEAALTGESEPVLKDPAVLDEDVPPADQRNMVFKGTAVAQGTGVAVVTATGMATEMGAIAAMLAETPRAPTPLQQEIRYLGRTLGGAVLAIAALVIAVAWWQSPPHTLSELVTVWMLGVSLAVAAVPEGLPAIVSIVLALGVQRMARRRAIVKDLASVETLGSASVICSDKTGTLTRSEMTIQRGVTASGRTELSGVGYAPHGAVASAGAPLTGGPVHSEHILLFSGGSLAGNAALHQTPAGDWVVHGDPTEAAFLVAERKLGVHEGRGARFTRVAELPFTSDRKMMSIVALDHAQGDARLLISKGAPDVLLARCDRVRVGLGEQPLSDAIRAQALADVDELSRAALRTLSVAYRPLLPHEDPASGIDLEQHLIFVGTVGIIDPPRPEAGSAIREAHRAGIRVIMITGDHPRTAERIAADLGIIEAGATALTGRELDAMSDAELAQAVSQTSVYARVTPQHKLRIVDALQSAGHVVAMTGDGVNDAPALKAANIGVAMGQTGTEVTKEAGQMILADDNFATIVAAVQEGRSIFDNLRKCLRYLLSSNMGEVLTVLLGVLGAGLLGLKLGDGAAALPLLATQILWINLITDAGPALALGVDPSTEDVMARQPRRVQERVIDGRMWRGVLGVGLVMALATLLTLDGFLPGGLLPGSADLATARTAAFTVLVLAQLFNCFNARSEMASAAQGLWANRWLWGAVGVSVGLQVAVVHLPWLNAVFQTRPMTAAQWGVCAAMASSVLWAAEVRKAGLRWRARGRRVPDPV